MADSTHRVRTLNCLEPSEQLLGIVFQQVDDSMLRSIAQADYGHDTGKHLKALVAIRDNQLIPAPMEWHPAEVLELIRWSEPKDPDGHLLRLFSCAVLLRATAEPENEGADLGEDSTIVQLVSSAMALGPEISRAALRFLCWRMQNGPEEDRDCPYLAIAVLFLCVFLGEYNREALRYLIDVALSDEDEIAVSELFADCLVQQTWKDLARSLLLEPAVSHPVEFESELRRVGTELIGSSKLTRAIAWAYYRLRGKGS